MLSEQEVASEINLSLIKKRGKLIEYMILNGGFNHQNFKKSAFVYSKNLIKWSHLSITNHSFVKKREDGTFYHEEDGFKTSFEIAVETKGVSAEDDPNNYVNLDQLNKYKEILNIIKKYYDILSEQEVKVLSLMELGLTEDEISNKFNITRQAVNFTAHKIYQKVKSYIKSEEVFDSNFQKVIDGNSSINKFFKEKSGNSIIKSHSNFLRDFIINKAYTLTIDEVTFFINSKFKTNYSKKQIACSLSKRKLYFLIKRDKN